MTGELSTANGVYLQDWPLFMNARAAKPSGSMSGPEYVAISASVEEQ